MSSTGTASGRLRRLGPWLLVALALLSAAGVIERTTAWMGPRQLRAANAEYLDQAFHRAVRTFAVLSAVKAALAVIEGSHVGVGFGIQVGDAVQATYDYVDIAWRTVLAGAVVLLGMKYALHTVSALDHWMLACALLAGALSMWLSRRVTSWRLARSLSQDSARVLLVTALAMYLLAPLSVSGASLLSRRITASGSSQAHARFEQLRNDLGRPESGGGILNELRATPERIKTVVTYLSGEGHGLGLAVIRLIAAYLFDCIVFPLGLFIAAFFIMRGMWRYLLDYGASQRIGESLRAQDAAQAQRPETAQTTSP